MTQRFQKITADQSRSQESEPISEHRGRDGLFSFVELRQNLGDQFQRLERLAGDDDDKVRLASCVC